MSGKTSNVDRAMVLRDAMTHAVTVERELKKKSGIKRSRAVTVLLIMALVPLMALSAYSWIARPEWLWGTQMRALPAVEQDANLRMAMFALGMRLDAFREETGAYPASLEHLRESVPGVAYTLLTDSTFQLSGMAAGREVVFTSDGNAEEFLGNAMDVIQSRRKP